SSFFFLQAEDGIRDFHVTGVQTCALPISYNGQPATQKQSRDKIFECYPQSLHEEGTCARQIISTLVSKAFRRPSTDADVLAMMEIGRAPGRERTRITAEGAVEKGNDSERK